VPGRALKLAFGAVLLAALLPAASALANDTTLNLSVYPPRPIGASDLHVRMKSEHITIHFGREESRVEVEFVFENLADYEATAWVGFPDEDLLNRYLSFIAVDNSHEPSAWQFYNMWEDEFGGPAADPAESRIEDFKTWMRLASEPESSSVELPYSIIRIERTTSFVPDLTDFPNAKWELQMALNGLLVCRAFELTWGPKQSLVVGHSYKTANGANVLGQVLFQYTLETGGNWRGTIGRADIDLYLEDGWQASDLRFKEKQPQEYEIPFTVPDASEFEQVSDTHLSATWRDFEPQGERGWIYIATQPTYPGGQE